MKPGFYTDMSATEYHATEAFSKSFMTKFDRSPAHAKVPEKPPGSQKVRNMLVGSAFHTTVLEPEKFEKEYVVLPEGKKRVGTHDADGRAILNFTEGGDLPGMREAVRNHEDAGPLLSFGQAEVSVFWQDPDYGFLCKARPDWITPNGIIIDLKSTEDAREEAFSRTAYNLRYRWQGYWYLNGASIAKGEPHNIFIIIAVEKEPPYGVYVYEVDKEMLLLAMEEIAPLLKKYNQSLKSDIWSCYPPGMKSLELPRWARRREFDD